MTQGAGGKLEEPQASLAWEYDFETTPRTKSMLVLERRGLAGWEAWALFGHGKDSICFFFKRPVGSGSQ